MTFSMFGKGVGKADLVPNVFGAIFEKYRTGQPSALLQTARQAAQLTYLGFLRYGPLAEPADVSAVLGYMRSLSFSHLEASVIHHRIAFASVEEFVEDRVAVFSPLEYAEMTPEGKRGLMDKCRAALGALLTDEGPVLEVEVVFFHGVK